MPKRFHIADQCLKLLRKQYHVQISMRILWGQEPYDQKYYTITLTRKDEPRFRDPNWYISVSSYNAEVALRQALLI